MKRIINCLFSFMLLCFAAKAQYVNIPDANFKAFLKTKYPTAFNGSGQMDTTNTLIANEDSLDCYNKNISSINGIQYFKALKYLTCGFNSGIISLPALPQSLAYLACNSCAISNLPTLPNTLKVLDCNFNPLHTLPTLPNNLTYLNCNGCQLTSLPSIGDSLQYLYLNSNTNLTCLPKLPAALYYLDINNTNIKCIPNLVRGSALVNLPICSNNFSVNVNHCTVYADSLKNLFIVDSGLGAGFISIYPDPKTFVFKNVYDKKYYLDTTASIVLNETNLDDKTGPTHRDLEGFGIKSLNGMQFFKSLKKLNVSLNKITTVDFLPEGLERFAAAYDSITTIQKLPNSLKILDLSTNKISSLNTHLPNLESLGLFANKLTQLPQLPNTIKDLNVTNNLLTNLPTTLPNSLQYMSVDGNAGLLCLPKLPALIISITIDTSKIKCLFNKPNNLVVYDANYNTISNYPVCNSSYNPNNCPTFSLTNYVNIPDTNFGAYLLFNYPNCLYKDANNLYWMDTTCSDVVNETILKPQNKNIKDLTGTQYFKNLVWLYCDSNQLTSLPSPLPVNLNKLYCGYNNLASLPSLPNNLETLYSEYNQLTSLPVLPKVASFYNFSHNSFTTMPNIDSAGINSMFAGFGIQFDFRFNNITCVSKLPDWAPSGTGIYTVYVQFDSGYVTCMPNRSLSHFPRAWGRISGNAYFLDSIICNSTNNPNNCPAFSQPNYVNIPDTNFGKFLLAQYPACLYKDANNKYWMDTTCAAILNETVIDWYNNPQPPLPVRDLEGVQYFKSLGKLNCFAVGLYHLRKLPPYLNYLWCSGTLDSLPALPSTLKHLNCAYSDIHWLPALPSGLEWLDCSGNPLNGGLPALPNSLQQLYCEKDSLTSIPRLPDSLYNFDCNDNPHLNCLPYLPSTLSSFGFSFSNTNIQCLPNKPAYLFTATPVCNATNNPNGCTVIPANYVNIPDTNFGKFLIAQYPTCLYKDASNMYWMDTTCGAVVNEDSINLYKYGNKNNNIRNSLSSLEGLQYFKHLKYLNCDYLHSLSYLPAYPITLRFISHYQNNLATITILPDSLLNLQCSNNKLNSLPILPASLITLSCQGNLIDTLPQLPVSLENLSFTNNQVSFLPSVLPKNLRSLFFINNKISIIPNLPDSLIALQCDANTFINKIPVLPQKLQILTLTSTLVECLPKLPVTLTTLMIDTAKIHCLPNSTSVFLDGTPNINNYPICNPTNNPNNCQSYPYFEGFVYNDNNSSNTYDAADAKRANVKISLTSGEYTFSNDDGYYHITADTIGSNTITITKPNFYNAIPQSITRNFANYYDKGTDTFALQPAVVKDSLATTITPLTRFFTPGTAAAFAAGFDNVGTTSLATTLTINYDNTKLSFDSFYNGNFMHTIGRMPTSFVNNGSSLVINQNLKAGERGYYLPVFTARTTLLFSDSVLTTSSLTGGTATGTDTSKVYVRASYDPNDKQSTPELTPQQVASGSNYIDYEIRFENTGNAPATTVIISDSLSPLLKQNAVYTIISSHTCSTYLKNGIAYFTFDNINLPDSHVNKIGCHGFIRFRVLPQANLALGAVVPNKAQIYFDYNAPVVTNIANTIIKNVIVPVELVFYTAQLKKQNDIDVVENTWVTASELNTSHFNIQRSTNGKDFITIGKVSAKGFGEYKFTDDLLLLMNNIELHYRLQIVDKNGKITYSTIKQITRNRKQETFSIYPNPSKGNVTIETIGVKEILIIDNLGRTVSRQSVNIQSSIVNIKLNKGVYILKSIATDGSLKTEKVIVE